PGPRSHRGWRHAPSIKPLTPLGSLLTRRRHAPMIILGLNAFHGDSSAALVRDGMLLAAAEEERFRRIKHWAGFPSESIAYCLREAGVSASDVDHLAVNQDDHAHFFRKMAFLITAVPDFGLVIDRLKKRRDRQSLPDLMAKA